jgi:glycerophosphoryl diester phosphodiesterase
LGIILLEFSRNFWDDQHPADCFDRSKISVAINFIRFISQFNMKIFSTLEARLRQVLDNFYARWPQSVPSIERLQQCRIVSHRGHYDNQQVFENTLAAFDQAKDEGIWGIEFDLRWTKDLHPVVIHDADLHRVFGTSLVVRQATLAELKFACPLVPSLEEMIRRYGKKMHLMAEIKAEPYPDPVQQNRILKNLFVSLVPEKDYHLLSLTPEMFKLIDFVPTTTFVPIARFNFIRLSQLAIEQNYTGIAGHYLLLSASRLTKHRKFKQKVGTGYINSTNCLFRELNRGVEWIFSDNAVELQKIVNQLLQKD